MKRKIYLVLVSIVITLILPMMVNASYTVNIPDIDPSNGTYTEVPVWVNTSGGDETTGVSINMTFDSNVIHIVDMSEGDWGSLTDNINNESGYVSANNDFMDGDSGNITVWYMNVSTIGGDGASTDLNMNLKELLDYDLNDVSDTATVSNGSVSIPLSYLPPDPTDLSNNTGNFWIDYLWSAGSGNITDYFRVWIDSSNNTLDGWYNETTESNFNSSLEPHGWCNATIYAYNTSSDGTLSDNSLTDNVTIPNNPVLIDNSAITNATIVQTNSRERATWMNETTVTLNLTDLDGSITGANINLTPILGSGNDSYSMSCNGMNCSVTVKAYEGINETHTLTLTGLGDWGDENTTTIDLTVLRRGDVNRDNSVSLSDAIYIKRHDAGGFGAPYDSIDPLVGDINPATGDGDVSLSDSIYIKRLDAGGFGYEAP